MANAAHVGILKQGVEAWNRWRKDNGDVKPNLRGVELGYGLNHADLSQADLSQVDLSQADLSEAILSQAVLRETNLSQAILRGADLSDADLSDADLRQANLSEVALHNANLRRANLSRTILYLADFSRADLNGAFLSGAFFRNANLSEANLSHANLSNVFLSYAILNETIISFADLTGAKIGWTMFGNVDLSEVKGLETIVHEGPSTIGIDTIYKSKGNIPYKFMLDAGIPKDDIAYLLSLAGKAIDFYSCFISYSTKDQAFCERLHADLQAKGVRCWYAPEDLKIGEPILAGIDRGIRVHDKLLLVLSEHSVASRWVEHEVEAALYEESQPARKTQVLFPIRLDETVLDTKVEWAYRIRQRHIGDFTQWKEHNTYQKAFERLLRDLKTGE